VIIDFLLLFFDYLAHRLHLPLIEPLPQREHNAVFFQHRSLFLRRNKPPRPGNKHSSACMV
ncbi:unnamed protein product, partial [Brassica rapa subsp. trilocularis]